MASSPPPPICFLRGTRIATPNGECPVEDLAVGDTVVTYDGAERPVKWIGRMTYRRNAPNWNPKVLPILIRRFAVDGKTPHRDLYVSRKHCILVDDVLVPAKYLVNGHSIVPAPKISAKVLEYFHIELESHDVVLAEGVPAETLRRNGRNIEAFDNFAEHFRLFPGEAETAVPFYARVLKQTPFNKAVARLGPVVAPMLERRGPIEEVRDRIAARALVESDPA